MPGEAYFPLLKNNFPIAHLPYSHRKDPTRAIVKK